jgi:hypothetical protein
VRAQTETVSPTTIDQLKALNDQTILQSRVWLDTEWDQYKRGAVEGTWTFGGAWTWRASDVQDWIVRGTLPVVFDRSDDASGNTIVGGLGDIEIASGTAFRLSDTWRTGGGVELHADTASNPALGDSVWRFASSWSVAHDFTKAFTANFTAEYDHSISEENGVSQQRYSELSWPISFIPSPDWSLSATYKLKVNFEKEDRCTNTVNIGVTKRLSNLPIFVSLSLEKPFDGGNKIIQANLTLTYYFQRYHHLPVTGKP